MPPNIANHPRRIIRRMLPNASNQAQPDRLKPSFPRVQDTPMDAQQTSFADNTTPVRVRSREGDLVEWSHEAARRAGALKDLIDDAPSEDGIYPAPVATSSLNMLAAMSELDYEPSVLNQLSTVVLAKLIEDAVYLDAAPALEHAQREFMGRLAGKSATEMREVLGALDDLPRAVRTAAVAEPAFTPEGIEQPSEGVALADDPDIAQPQPSFFRASITEDAKEAALGKVDSADLIMLKGVSHDCIGAAQRVLCSRVCRFEGTPALANIIEIDVEFLAEAGRAWDMPVAGRLLPKLARLRGYGYTMDVAAVRVAALPIAAAKNFSFGCKELRGCISPCKGEPPLMLLQAGVACAASGEVWGVPVQLLREDNAIGVLDLGDRSLEPIGSNLLGLLLPRATSLTELR